MQPLRLVMENSKKPISLAWASILSKNSSIRMWMTARINESRIDSIYTPNSAALLRSSRKK